MFMLIMRARLFFRCFRFSLRTNIYHTAMFRCLMPDAIRRRYAAAAHAMPLRRYYAATRAAMLLRCCCY